MLAATLTMLIWPQVVSAGYMNSYSDWKKLGSSMQSIYAMGLYDAETGGVIRGLDWTIATAQGLSDCSVELSLNGILLAEAINNFYAADLQRWSFPVSFAFHSAIIKGVCLRHINTERAKYGLHPWKAD